MKLLTLNQTKHDNEINLNAIIDNLITFNENDGRID